MKVFLIAAVAVAISGAAFAKDIKKEESTTTPVVKGTAMNDAEMDKVTAGISSTGYSHAYPHACSHAGSSHIPFC